MESLEPCKLCSDTSSFLCTLHSSADPCRQVDQPLSFPYRPEIQARHTAFKRGSAYLERYCLLIAFTAYLEDRRRRRLPTTFEDWMEARPDLCQARNSILNNPAGW